MAMDPRKRQKKLEKQKAKKKAERRAIARRESRGFAPQFQAAANSPILHCCMREELWEKGIGEVLISRSLPNGNVAFAVFLVDVYCLGVKDAYSGIRSRLEYEDTLYGKIRRQSEIVSVKAEYARKLVEGAVQYAEAIGFSPHADYRVAKLIFGDISADSCTEQFVYGRDGKPFFIAGPYDDEYRCRHIVKTMESHCGPGGYHYLLPIDDPASFSSANKNGEFNDGTIRIDEDGMYYGD